MAQGSLGRIENESYGRQEIHQHKPIDQTKTNKAALEYVCDEPTLNELENKT